MTDTPNTNEAPAAERVIVRPRMIAEATGADPKQIRAYLRKTYPRTIEEHNTDWMLTPEQTKQVIAHFKNRPVRSAANEEAQRAEIERLTAELEAERAKNAD